MKFRILYCALFTGLLFSCDRDSFQTEIGTAIESLLQETEQDSLLVKAYEKNEFKPIWVQKGGLKKSGKEYLEALEEIAIDGLDKEDYISEKQNLFIEESKELKEATTLAELDLHLSKSFLALASDLNIGRIDPGSIKIEWEMERKSPTDDYADILVSIADGESTQEALNNVRPKNPRYEELRILMEKLLSNPSEDNHVVESFEGKIELGDEHPAMSTIRQKLILWEAIEPNSGQEGNLYGEDLVPAIKNFQKRHGFIADGIIGQDFIDIINYSHQDLITKTKVNLERLRWLPDFTDNEKNKVIVNIPDFNLFFMEDGDTILSSKVVVGKDYRQTPVFKSEMTYLVFSPTWTLPETILWEDAIPAIRKDRGYLNKHNMKVLDFDGNEIDPRNIKWDKLEGKADFPYMIRQSPGKQNPLGQVKFMFPNDYSIYIHDSPAQSLFTTDERMFSSGCIRMEKPVEFASLLLEEVEGWDAEKINASMNLDEEKNVSLDQPQEVWILYLSVWVNEGNPQVRKDIYEMDKKLAEAMGLNVSPYFL